MPVQSLARVLGSANCSRARIGMRKLSLMRRIARDGIVAGPHGESDWFEPVGAARSLRIDLRPKLEPDSPLAIHRGDVVLRDALTR